MNWSKIGFRVLLAFLIVYLAVLIYAFRWYFTTPYDATYWKDRYEQSQWRLPLSPRIIGDDGLFQYQGYLLSHGADPSLFNAEVPPVGKYLIGWTIRVFQNGNLTGLFVTALAAILLFILSKQLTKNSLIALGITILCITDPLITDQFHIAMLDSPQLMFLLAALISMVHLSDKRARYPTIFSVLAGSSIGLFAGTKAPVLAPLLVVVFVVLLLKQKKGLLLLPFFIAVFSFYLLPYLYYFRLGHTLMDWIRLQSWMAHAYLSSDLKANYGSIFTTLLLNRYQDLFSHIWAARSEWSPLWPVIFLLSSYGVIHNIVMRRLVPLSAILSGAVIVYAILPFWPRYLVGILPLLYLVAIITSIQHLKKQFVMIGIVMGILLNCIAVFPTLYPSPDATMTQFFYSWEQGLFQDMYQELSDQTKIPSDSRTFHQFGQSFIRSAEIENITAHIPNNLRTNLFATSLEIPVTVVYHTHHLGSFSHQTVIHLSRNHNRWYVDWNWNNLLPQATVDSTLKTTVIPGQRGALTQGMIVAADQPSWLVTITPNLIDKTQEQEMLTLLERLFKSTLRAVHIHHRYTFNTQPNDPISIGVLPPRIPQETLEQLRSFPGVTLRPANGRILNENAGTVANTSYTECCSLLYSPTTYHGVSGFELTYDEKLRGQDGGTVVLKNPGKPELILKQQPALTGTDVTLED